MYDLFDIKKVSTSIAILIDISYVFHSESKHGVFRPKKIDWSNTLPVFSFVVDIDVDCSSNHIIFSKELRCSYSKVIPSVRGI